MIPNVICKFYLHNLFKYKNLLYFLEVRIYYESFLFMNNSNKVALITGITGQDGSYLAEFLLEKNYIVHESKEDLQVLILIKN